MARQRGSGSITVRTTKGGDVYYGQWWVTPAQKASRRLGPVRKAGSKTGLTPNMAEAALRKIMAEVQPTPEPEGGAGIRFAEAGRIYTKALKRAGRKKATTVAVESCLRVWVIPRLGHKPLNTITYEDLDALVTEMESGRNGRRPLSAKSISNYLGTVSAIFTFGMDERRRWTTTNPARAVDLPAVEGFDDIRFLTPEEVDAVVRAVPDEYGGFPNAYADLDRVLIRTAAMTGLREGELIALRWGAVDWPARKIRVRRNYVLGEDIEPKSQKSKRAVPMADVVARDLAAFQPHDATEEDLVFADPITGTYMSNAAILRRFRRALKLAGLPARYRFHDLRHTFATRMAAHGVPMRTLQEWLGHADIQTTMRYADYAPNAREAEVVDAAFASPPISEGVPYGVPAVDQPRDAE